MDEHTEETADELAYFLMTRERVNARMAAMRRTNAQLRALVADETKRFENALDRLRKEVAPVVNVPPRIGDDDNSASSNAPLHNASSATRDAGASAHDTPRRE